MNCQANELVALQRTDQFIGRTTNWLYDHLRYVSRYRLVVISDSLLNRKEFPLLKAWSINRRRITRRLWHRVLGDRPYWSDALRLKLLAPRVLHSHFGYVAGDDYALQERLQIPWFISFYGADVYQLGRDPEWREKYDRIFQRAARVLALGPAMASKLRQFGCPMEKVTIHPLGVDVDNLPVQPRIIEPGKPLRLLFAGTFREKKGIEYVVQGVAIARRAGVRLELHLVGEAGTKPGDDETREAVIRAIRKLSIEDIVTHYRFLNFQSLLSLALRSHVFVAPSVTALDGDAEGTPFVLQQMMATGMPVIATDHSDIPYLFGEYRHLLVPERDARAIADRIQKYVEDPIRLVTDGMALRNQVGKFLAVRDCAARLSDLYDAVIFQ